MDEVKKTKKQWLVPLIIVCSIGVLIHIFYWLFFVYGAVLAFVPIHITNINKYLKTDGQTSSFCIFPDEIEDSYIVNKYFYNSYGIVDGQEIMLDVTFTQEDFDKEIERLENERLQWKNSSKVKDVVSDKECLLFYYPTYVSIFNDRLNYEYACVDEENNRIVYVFLSCMSHYKVSIPDEFLPKEYKEKYKLYYEFEYDSEDLYPYHYSVETSGYDKWIY